MTGQHPHLPATTAARSARGHPQPEFQKGVNDGHNVIGTVVTGQLRRLAPVALLTAATIFAAMASISASVSVLSFGCRRTLMASDFLPSGMPLPS